MTEHQLARAIALWNTKADTLEIAKELGLREADVYNALGRLKHRPLPPPTPHFLSIEGRAHRKVPMELADDYRLLTRKGYHPEQAAKILGLEWP